MVPQLSQNFESGLLSKLQLGHLNPCCADTSVAVVEESPSKIISPTFFILSQLILTSLPSTFNAISGMSVFDENAKQIGIAKQVGVDSKNQVVLVVSDNEGNDVSINWERIKKVGEKISASARFCTECGVDQ